MAQTEILSSISRSTTYPITATMSAPNNCGLLSVVLDNSWTDQMLHELPTINVKIYTESNTLITSFDINMRTVNSNTRQVSAAKPYSIPIYELPSSYVISVTPLFDVSAITSHNELVENGIETSAIWTTETSTFNVSFSFDDVNIHAGGSGGGSGGVEVISEGVWNSYTKAEKNAYGLVAIQSSNVGYKRGTLVFGEDYMGYDFTVITSGWAATTTSYTFSTTGNYKLFVIAMNSEASTFQLTTSASLNSSTLTGTIVDSNDYTSSGDNKRNYKVTLFNVSATSGDSLSITLGDSNAYSSFVYVVMAADVEQVSKALTTPDGVTSGSYSEEAITVFGTFNANQAGTINISHYTANDTITTDNPGTDYKSSYIFWFTI